MRAVTCLVGLAGMAGCTLSGPMEVFVPEIGGVPDDTIVVGRGLGLDAALRVVRHPDRDEYEKPEGLTHTAAVAAVDVENRGQVGFGADAWASTEGTLLRLTPTAVGSNTMHFTSEQDE